MTRTREIHPVGERDIKKRDSSPIFSQLGGRDLWEQMMSELDAG